MRSSWERQSKTGRAFVTQRGRGRAAAEAADATSRFRLWFPVLPFLVFWALAFIAYQAGPFVNAALAWQTYGYLLLSYLAVVWGYQLAVGRRPSRSRRVDALERARAARLLAWTAPISAAGSAGLVLDRLLSGAGSVEKTLFETQTVREWESVNTTILTTLSVAPYSLWLVALACYFYCRACNARISRFTTWAIYAQVALLSFNAFLSANRGVFFWIGTYWLFFIFFVHPNGFRQFRRQAKASERAALVGFVVLGVAYSAFIAANRNSEVYLKTLAQDARRTARIDLTKYQDRDIATLTALFVYGTHQFAYVDAFVARADALAFRPAPLIGGRILDQIGRVDPEFGRATEVIFVEWIRSAGLSEWGWASVWGYSLPMFGWLGSIGFFLCVGYAFGAGVRRYIERSEVGVAIIVFSFYAALNMSFNWIGGDTTHNMGYLVGLLLIATAARRPRRGNRKEKAWPVASVRNYSERWRAGT